MAADIISRATAPSFRGRRALPLVETSAVTCRRLARTTRHASSRPRLHARAASALSAATLSRALGMLAVAPIVPCRDQILDAIGAAPKKETTQSARSCPCSASAPRRWLHSRGLLWTRRRRGRRAVLSVLATARPRRRRADGPRLLARSRRSPARKRLLKHGRPSTTPRARRSTPSSR